MAKRTPNIDIVGIKSIRLGGMKLNDLPIAEAASVRYQIPLAEDTQRQNKINNLMKKYPTQRVDYLKNRVAECEANIVNVNEMKARELQLISDYTSQLSLCKFRDSEVDKLDESEESKKTRKELFKKFPPYDVVAMETQIEQSKAALVRADQVIAAEHDSIAEFREHTVLCERRDMELRNLGVGVVAG